MNTNQNLPKAVLNEATIQDTVRQTGSYQPYLQALDAAWAALAAQPLDGSALAEAVCYTLARARLVKIASALHPALVRRAVELRLWTRDYARSLAALMPSEEIARASLLEIQRNLLLQWLNQDSDETYAALEPDLSFLDPPQRRSDEPVEASLQRIIGNYGHDEDKTRPDLPEQEPITPNRWDHLELLSLIPHLPEHTFKQAYAFVRRLAPSVERAELLTALAERGAAPVSEALESVEQRLMDDAAAFHPRALRGLYPLLTVGQQRRLLDLARRSSKRDVGIALIAELAPHLEDDLREEALHFAFGSLLMLPSGDYARSNALYQLMPLLRGDLLRQAVEVVLAESDLSNPYEAGINLLVAAVPNLPATLRRKVLDSIRHLALMTSNQTALAALMQELAPEERRAVLDEALELPVENKFNMQRSHDPLAPKTLAYLIPYLEGADRARAIEAAYEMALTLPDVGGGFEYIYSPIAEAVAELAPYLEGARLHEALNRGLQAALSLPETHHMDSRPRALALAGLADHLPPDLLQPLLDRAFAPTSVWNEKLLANLLPYVPAQQQATLLHRLIDKGLADDRDPQGRSFWLAGLLEEAAPFLQGEALGRALTITLEMSPSFGGSYSRGQTLTALAASLTPTMLHEALDRLAEIRVSHPHGQRMYDEACAVLAPCCRTSDLIERLAEAAGFIESDDFRAQTLAALVPQLLVDEQRPLLEAVLDVAGKTRPAPGAGRLRQPTAPASLRLIAPYLTGDLAARALNIALGHDDVEFQADALIALLPYLAPAARQTASTQALDATFEASSVYRARRLAEIAPELTAQQCDQTLDRILENPDAILIKDHLISIAPYLTDAGLSRLLEATLGIVDAFTLWKLLDKVAPILRGANLRRVVDFLLAAPFDDDFVWRGERSTAPRRSDDYFRGRILALLISHLEPAMRAPVAEAIQQLRNPLGRAQSLAAFANHQLKAGPEKRSIVEAALRAAMQIPHEGEQISALEGFEWDPATTTSAIALAQTIADPLRRARILARLLPHALDAAPVTAAVQTAVFEYLRPGNGKAPGFLPVCEDPLLCKTPIFSEDGLARIARLMSAIFEEWQWP